MKRLLLAAFKNPKHRMLFLMTILAMTFLTVASQLEIFALGIITKKGTDFFELFAPMKDGKLIKSDVISWNAVTARWEQIASEPQGNISLEDATQFVYNTNHADVIQQAINTISKVIPIKENLRNLAIFLVFVALFKAITLFAHRFSTRILAIRVSQELRQQYFEHIQTLPMSFYQKYNTGTLSARVVGDAALIAEAVSACMVNYIQTPITVISTLVLCFLTSWQLSLIIFLGFPLIIFPIAYIAKKVKIISRQIQKNQEHFSSVLIEFLMGIQTVKMFAMEDFSLKKYREHNQKMATLEKRSARYDLSSRPVVHTIGMSFLSIALLYGLYVLKLSVSEAFFYCGLLFVFYEPIKKFAEENSHIQRGITAADRMFEVLAIKSQIQDEPNAVELNNFKDQIEFDGVTFGYDEHPVLRNISFTIQKGETVAIVGPTGAGKSTLVHLLPRLYEVQEGEIRIDGRPLKSYTQKSIRELIAFVPQKPFFFIDTVAENISFGRKFNQHEVEEAARKAHAEEFILKMPDKYHTELSEAGKNLSVGQQQRLAIARALVKKGAQILILDEATSSLDNVSEYNIKGAMKNLKGEVTQILIAHRLSTIEDADRIIYIENGKKAAEGSKNELLKNCPGFREMWERGMHGINT